MLFIPFSLIFGHIHGWDQCAVHILYSKIFTDPGLLKFRHSHRCVAVIIQILIPCVVQELGAMSKNNSRAIILVRGPLRGILSLTLIISCSQPMMARPVIQFLKIPIIIRCNLSFLSIGREATT